jgi:hypothetical protein
VYSIQYMMYDDIGLGYRDIGTPLGYKTDSRVVYHE